ncbi:hypothetical protein ACU6Y4_19975 [Klebsiella aerogenes]
MSPDGSGADSDIPHPAICYKFYCLDADPDPGDAGVNRAKMLQWLKTFPGALNDIGDLPVIKRGKGHFSGA